MLANAYPKYRRRDNGRTAVKGDHVMDNRDVVPYNPGLTKKYHCHLNVEVVASIKAVKYIYKYIHKGHDRAAMELREEGQDEIEEHLNARYVGPAEACWRLFESPLAGKSHNVERLAVHLEDEQAVVFEEGTEAAAAAAAASRDTTLTAWFKLNAADVEARQWTYQEIPEHYRWLRQERVWRKRESLTAAEKVIGRMHGASPGEQERFYLYLVLLGAKGPTSWEDLKHVPDKVAPFWRDVAEARGLVDSDEEYLKALTDVAALKTASRLRIFFAHLVLQCELREPALLWETFAEDMTEDFLRRYHDQSVARSKALYEVQAVLERAGKRLRDFGLPEPEDFDDERFNKRELLAARAFNVSGELRAAADKKKDMREDQAAAFDAVVEALRAQQGGVFFVDGPGGSGKTFLQEALLHHVRGQGDIALPCAWSGIAATLLPGGKTCHGTFGFPVPLPSAEVPSSITWQSGRAAVLRQAALIIWDEAPMSPSEAVDGADALLQDLCEDARPFGGKVVVFAGDFRQVLPVMPHASREQVVSHSLRNHRFWRDGSVQLYPLTGNARAREDAAYADFLLRVGDGVEQTYPVAALIA